MWATVSESLRSLWKNERMSESLGFFRANCSFSLSLTKNERFTQKNSKKSYFCMFFQFFKFFKKAKVLLIPSFLLSEVSELLRSLRTYEWKWAIRSGHSEGMSDCEQIAQVAHQKWANEQIAHFLSELLICSLFFGKKWVIRSKIWWGNSHPCKNHLYFPNLTGHIFTNP